MNISFFKTSSDTRKLNKSLTTIKESSIVLKATDDILNPVITVNIFDSWEEVNYAQIDAYNRYYFIDSIRILNGNILEIHLKVDVLMSYKNYINNTSAIISRSGNIGNSYLIDNKIKTVNYPNYETKIFPKGFSNNLSYVLIVNG